MNIGFVPTPMLHLAHSSSNFTPISSRRCAHANVDSRKRTTFHKVTSFTSGCDSRFFVKRDLFAVREAKVSGEKSGRIEVYSMADGQRSPPPEAAPNDDSDPFLEGLFEDLLNASDYETKKEVRNQILKWKDQKIKERELGQGRTSDSKDEPNPRILQRRTKLISFICKVCETRVTKQVNPLALQRGTVLIECDGCKERHVIADNLNILGYGQSFEELVGDKVKMQDPQALKEVLTKLVAARLQQQKSAAAPSPKLSGTEPEVEDNAEQGGGQASAQ